jgi:hypothetical protein
MDEGHVLLFANMLARGEGLMYRDATSYPLPGAFELLALVYRFVEPSVLVARWLVVLVFAAFTALLFALLRRCLPLAWSIAAVGMLWVYRVWAFPHWHMYNYSSLALAVLLGSLVALLRYTETRRRGTLAFAGVLFGLGVYCKQDYGAAFLLAACATLVVYHRRQTPPASLAALFAGFLVPAALVGALAGIHFWLQGQLGFVVQLTVLNHFVGLSSYEYEAFPPLLPLFQQDPLLRTSEGLHNLFPSIVAVVHGLEVQRSAWFNRTALYDTALKLFIFGPRLLVLAGALRLWRRPDAPLAEVALWSVAAALALLSAVYRPQDFLHLAVLYWAFLALLLVHLHALLGARPRLALALLGVPGVAIAGYSGWLAISLRTVFTEPIDLPRAGIYAKPDEARVLEQVVHHIETHTTPDQTVAALPYFPIALFLAGRLGPHAAAYILWPFPEYPDRDRRIIEAMEARSTPLVIWNYTQFPHFPPVEQYAPELYAYLVENFEVERVFNEAAFSYSLAALERQAPVPGRPLLGDAASLELRWPGGRSQTLAPARQAEFLRSEVWPFRPVRAVRAPVGGLTAVSIPLAEVPPGARVHTAVGVHPSAWFRHPPSNAYFSIVVIHGGERTLAASKVLSPHLRLEDRGWFELDASLEPWVGEAVEVELVTRQDGAPLRPEDAFLMGGWSEPRLVVAEDVRTDGRVAPEDALHAGDPDVP